MGTLLASAVLGLGLVTSGNFAVDGVVRHGSVAVATIQPRNGAPGYSWLRVYFYPSALSAHDRTAAATGRIAAIRQPWAAVLQFTLDESRRVWQIDLSLPGHTCTVAESDKEALRMLSRFQLEGRQLRLVSRGSHVCDMTSPHVPNQAFTWDVDLAMPVVQVAR